MIESRAPKSSYSKVLKSCPFWVKLFLLSLVLPTEFSFNLAGLRFSPYRLVILLAFVPALVKLLSRGFKKVALADWLIIFHVIWCFIVINSHHDLSVAMESGGIRILEVLGAYFIARAYIVDEKSFYATSVFIFTLIFILLPFAIAESITGIHMIKILSAKIVGASFHSNIEPRLGLTRAYASFDHPILFGIFASSILGLVYYLRTPTLGYPRKLKARLLPSLLGTFLSLSSGAMSSMMTQLTLIFWEIKTRKINNRWRFFSFLLILFYVITDMISNRSAMKVFLSYLTFSAGTAYNRITIFDYGIQDVWRNPLLGIGFNEWTRPSWMHSLSMDNFWLLQAVTFGIPGFLSLAIPFIFMLSKNWKPLSARVSKLRTGWSISMIGMIISACTVHFWNNQFVYFIFFLGMGAWFLNVERRRYPDTLNAS